MDQEALVDSITEGIKGLLANINDDVLVPVGVKVDFSRNTFGSTTHTVSIILSDGKPYQYAAYIEDDRYPVFDGY